jgi:hypothetical protein
MKLIHLKMRLKLATLEMCLVTSRNRFTSKVTTIEIDLHKRVM